MLQVTKNLNTDYPLALMPLTTQIAGHGSEGDGQRAIFKREDGKLLKPIQAPPKGQREADFYTSINKSTDKVDISLKKHIPEFYGIETVGFTNGITVTEDFLVLKDITEGFALPNIMDIKIGSRTWDPDASATKRAQEDSKYVGTKGPFGFSVLGMIVHSLNTQHKEATGTAHVYDKSFGKCLKTEDVGQVTEMFFDVQRSGGPVKALVDVVVKKIREILDAFAAQRKYKIYASSLLLAYDAKTVRQFVSGSCGAKQLQSAVNIKLIDFAHVFPADGERDDNFVSGLENLLSLFEQCVE